MDTRAAILTGGNRPWEVVTLQLDPPKAGEVQIKLSAAGLCHSDEHVRDGSLFDGEFLLVGGHEGAGVVEVVGDGVADLAPGDHVVCSFLPACGRCRYCATGHQNLCELGANAAMGTLLDGTYRFHRDGTGIGAMCALGTFSERAVVSQYSVVKINADVSLNSAALVGCGVTTGWGAAVHTGGVAVGDTVVVYGVGGVGINAVQGASHAGARRVVAVDPVAFKRDTALKLGATHVFADAAAAQEFVTHATAGKGAEVAVVTTSTADSAVISAGFDVIGKGSTLVLVSAGGEAVNIQLSGSMLSQYEKTIKGSLFGSSNPTYDIIKMLSLYQDGLLELDGLITTTYSLDQVNEGFSDLVEGRNMRGVIVFD